MKCAVYNRQNRKVFNLFYANLTVLPQLSDYSECNYSYFGLFSGVNSVIEDQSVYITKKPDDIKTTVGETIRIEVRENDVCSRLGEVERECINNYKLCLFRHIFSGRIRRFSRTESLLDESGE